MPIASSRVALALPASFLLMVLVSPTTQAQGLSYSVKKIGPLPGHSGSFGHGINASGEIVGWSDTVAGYHWKSATIVALPPLAGGSLTSAEGITNAGVVLGSSNAAGATGHATAWFPTAGGFSAVDLGIAPGDWFSGALAMDAGLIVGYSDDGLNPHPAVWTPPVNPPGSYTVQVLPYVAGDFAGYANAIDASGRAYGYTASFGFAHATRWTSTGGVWSVADLGALAPNFGAEAYDVDAAGTAVGYSVSPATFVEHAVLWNAGGIVDLGAPYAGWRATALGINNNGDVVGKSGSFAYDTAWVRPAATGTMLDLNSHLPIGTAWSVIGATDIADDGRIVGWGDLNGFTHSFLLTPVSTFLTTPIPGIAGQVNTVTISGATTGGTVDLVWNRFGGETVIAGCRSINYDIKNAVLIGSATAGAGGSVTISFSVPGSMAGSTILFQARDVATCRVTNVTSVAF